MVPSRGVENIVQTKAWEPLRPKRHRCFYLAVARSAGLRLAIPARRFAKLRSRQQDPCKFTAVVANRLVDECAVMHPQIDRSSNAAAAAVVLVVCRLEAGDKQRGLGWTRCVQCCGYRTRELTWQCDANDAIRTMCLECRLGISERPDDGS
jgi:hypothetical protein